MDVELQAQSSTLEAPEERPVRCGSDPQNGVSVNITDTAERDQLSDDGDWGVQGADEASRLKALAADVRDQDDLERDIGRQVRPILSRTRLAGCAESRRRQISCFQSRLPNENKSGWRRLNQRRGEFFVAPSAFSVC